MGFQLTILPVEAEPRIWLGAYSNTLVENGGISLENLPAGRQRIRVDAPGYQPYNNFVTLDESGSGVESIELVPIMERLRIESDPGALVEAVNTAGVKTNLGTTTAQGVLLAENILNIGTYELQLSKVSIALRL